MKYSVFTILGLALVVLMMSVSSVYAIPLVDEFVEAEIKNANMTASSNQIDDHILKFFAIQHASSGSISEINETTYSLELNDISDKTILFSERPDRIVKSVSTSDFVGNWSTGIDSFVADAPNAVLVVDEQKGIQDIRIIELFNPVYDSGKKTLKYNIIPDNATSIELPNEFGLTTIMIDLDAVLRTMALPPA